MSKKDERPEEEDGDEPEEGDPQIEARAAAMRSKLTAKCHRGIIFAFFEHFLHSLFSLLNHSYAFSVMFYAYALTIFNLPMIKILI